MKPFNFDKALAGHPLITYGGQKIIDFKYDPQKKGYCIEALIEGNEQYSSYFKDGTRTWFDDDEPHYKDLFMDDDEGNKKDKII